MNVAARTILAGSLSDLRRSWPQLIAADFVARTFALAVLTPACGLLVKLFLLTTATGVVTDVAIVDFLLHPLGLAALLICGSFSLATWFTETSQLMVIGFGSIEKRRVRALPSLKYVLRRGTVLLRLALRVVLRLLLIASPFLAAIGVVYWIALREHDINFYLAERPLEFKIAVAAAGLLLTVMALLLVRMVAGWLLALPMVLFEGIPARQAMDASEQATEAQRWKLVLWLIAWTGFPVLLSALVNLGASRLTDAIIPRDGSEIWLVISWLSGLLLVTGLAHLAILIGATVLFPLAVVRLYRSMAGPGTLNDELAAAGLLGDHGSRRIPGRAVVMASTGMMALAAGSAYLFMRTVDWQEHSQIIAHRGGAAAAPENTLAAFERGIADGASWLEIDVQENADDIVVVAHDGDFMRVARSDRQVYQATQSELDNLDVGSFFSPKFADQRVPTLREVLELAKGRVGVFIELKYYRHDRSLEAKVVELVESTGMASNIVIMSLEYAGVRKTAAMRPDWTYGLLSAVALGDVTTLDVNFVAVAAQAASYSTIRRAHARGLKVYAWTINDPVQMWLMMSRGVDGIITDRVVLARQVQDLRTKLTPLGRFVIWIAGEAGLLRGKTQPSSREDA